ncbi:multiple antibiotic resistance protein [Rhodovulum imhoffii]|uniref:UPF0056 membrane protein n=1 Tax=Rhodovulum imhoffii TaxID=365340 RepID=A0A2T5BVL4_9RHOB|nr:MarC family protein [Rhodovulum imhoffii]MBK5932823.1 MarC family transcriptional regulator [Rhodovulum imhoffii]PTN03608.1 multiple antibiotic resistance protein [Rhodovulum imhoffii]
MDLTFYISAFVTMFVIIDPIGLAPVFVAVTQGMNSHERKRIALRAVGLGALLLMLFGLFGESILTFVGISMPAFRISGGILLFLTALDMLFERRAKRREDQSHEERPDPSVFPLATPLIAGPGAIASMILLMGKASGHPLEMILINLVMLSVLGILLVLFLAGGLLERALGRTGTNVITRLLGMLLAALSVQFVLDGLRDFGLPG